MKFGDDPLEAGKTPGNAKKVKNEGFFRGKICFYYFNSICLFTFSFKKEQYIVLPLYFLLQERTIHILS